MALMALAIMRLTGVSLARGVLPVTFFASCLSWFVARSSLTAERKLKKRIDQFLFEDYVHAEKN